MQFSSLKRATLSSQVADLIQVQIEDGTIAPNARLPSERILSEQFDVSRVAVREAIQVLQAKGFVEVRQGKGSIAVEPATRNASNLSKWVNGREKALHMMVELRGVVEPGIAKLAASNASENDAAALLEKARLLETCPEEDVSSTDADFHQEIARITGNELICELVEACLKRSEPLRERTLKDRARRELAAAGHFAIANAIAERDPEKAQAAMLKHLDDADKSI